MQYFNVLLLHLVFIGTYIFRNANNLWHPLNNPNLHVYSHYILCSFRKPIISRIILPLERRIRESRIYAVFLGHSRASDSDLFTCQLHRSIIYSMQSGENGITEQNGSCLPYLHNMNCLLYKAHVTKPYLIDCVSHQLLD